MTFYAKVADGTVQFIGSRPNWIAESGAPVTDAVLIAGGWYPVADEAPPYDPATQRIERQPQSEWTIEADRVLIGYEVIDMTAEEIRARRVPSAVTMRQARLAMHAAGILDQVEAAIAAGDRANSIEWEYATTFERDHPLVQSLSGALGLSDEQVDDLFVLAATK